MGSHENDGLLALSQNPFIAELSENPLLQRTPHRHRPGSAVTGVHVQGTIQIISLAHAHHISADQESTATWPSPWHGQRCPCSKGRAPVSVEGKADNIGNMSELRLSGFIARSPRCVTSDDSCPSVPAPGARCGDLSACVGDQHPSGVVLELPHGLEARPQGPCGADCPVMAPQAPASRGRRRAQQGWCPAGRCPDHTRSLSGQCPREVVPTVQAASCSEAFPSLLTLPVLSRILLMLEEGHVGEYI